MILKYAEPCSRFVPPPGGGFVCWVCGWEFVHHKSADDVDDYTAQESPVVDFPWRPAVSMEPPHHGLYSDPDDYTAQESPSLFGNDFPWLAPAVIAADQAASILAYIAGETIPEAADSSRRLPQIGPREFVVAGWSPEAA